MSLLQEYFRSWFDTLRYFRTGLTTNGRSSWGSGRLERFMGCLTAERIDCNHWTIKAIAFNDGMALRDTGVYLREEL